MPTQPQLIKLYIACNTITNIMFEPIHIVRLDERTGNLFILAGVAEELELEITPTGELINESN
jgi:hypothetical protein